MPTPEAYTVSLRSRASREIRNLDRPTLARSSKAIDGLSENPRPTGCLKVKTSEGRWRIRVGDWRVGYEIDDDARQVSIITVGHRRDFYE
ncbi:MAG: type II toxin-antitoxin system RelE/ParE family toxin [Acidobacteriota bacterium]|nr:type II toxin-antitoxin system RelE/ParE family toxin [Acidobacteriota bacterium]